MFAPKPDPVRLESNASAWNSYDMQLQYFNINLQRFNSRLGSWQSESRLFSLLSIIASLSLLNFLSVPCKSSQTMHVLKEGAKGEVFDKRCLKCLSEFLQKLTSFYSQTRSSVPVANELMNSFTEK